MQEPLPCMQAALAELEKACPRLEDELASLRAALEPAQPENSAEAAAKRLEAMRQLFTPAQPHSTAEASSRHREPPTSLPGRQPAEEAGPHSSEQQLPQVPSAISGLAGLGGNAVVKRHRMLQHASLPAGGHQQQTSPAAPASLAASGTDALVMAIRPPGLLGGPAKGRRATASHAKATAILRPNARGTSIARGARTQPYARDAPARPCNVPAVPKAHGLANSQQQSRAHDIPMSPSEGLAQTPSAAALLKARAYRMGRDNLRSARKQSCDDATPPTSHEGLPHSHGAAPALESRAQGSPKSNSMRKRDCHVAYLDDSADAAKDAMGKKMRTGEDANGRRVQANAKEKATQDKARLRPGYTKALLTIPHRLANKARQTREVRRFWQLHHKGVAGISDYWSMESDAQCPHIPKTNDAASLHCICLTGSLEEQKGPTWFHSKVELCCTGQLCQPGQRAQHICPTSGSD